MYHGDLDHLDQDDDGDIHDDFDDDDDDDIHDD